MSDKTPPEGKSAPSEPATPKANGHANGHAKPAGKPRVKQADPAAVAWRAHLDFNKDGNVRSNFANALTALRQAPELVRLVGFDQMANLPMIRRFVPGSSRRRSGSLPRPLEDVDEGAVREWLQREIKMTSLPEGELRRAIQLVAAENAFHPVRDYLTALRWDGTVRLYRWLERHLGVARSLYASEVGSRFLIAMVARVMQPGCQADHMLVLEGPQGTGKSSACRILAGEWFSDNLPDLNRCDPVRLSMHLQGKWLIEVAELSAIGRSGVDTLKAFLTQTQERYVRKFAHHEATEARQCLFIGSTNRTAEYLHDETGARRFWPVLTSNIDLDGLRRNRDQLFAEATHLYLEGKPWWPDRTFEAEHLAPQQEARHEADAWSETIAKFLGSRVETTLTQVAQHGLGMQIHKVGTIEQRRVSAVLLRLGWVQGPRRSDRRPWVKKLSH